MAKELDPFSLLTIPQPHYIYGYTGYCPQYIFREGDTYGNATHKILIDSSIAHAPYLILSDQDGGDVQVEAPTKEEIDLVHSRSSLGDPLFQHPMVTRYDGNIPRMGDRFGAPFPTLATQAIAEHHRHWTANKKRRDDVKHLLALQKGSGGPRSLHDRMLTQNDFKTKLHEVRPECEGIMKSRFNEPFKQYIPDPKDNASPYFMCVDNKNKYFIPGTTYCQPFKYKQFGCTEEEVSRRALTDFTNNYNAREVRQWAPILEEDMPLPWQIEHPPQPRNPIYREDSGLVPRYTGFVPGLKYRCGKTYGHETFDAKRWIRGDFSN
ncbi:UPF0605 protein CG18335-like [Ctenocephalides felis]|uniref:UPF0605 protein CG18335-like n=1 Tax=Ctenocephalides felis TaxID=7515 RepID=UPI000E6E22C7|nr:UPF0605 protein CG18335-like [Ctenocephalides felis]